MARTIGDGLYGYVTISRIEHRLLGEPEALRLHHILQNSTVYHTYVNNRGSRFPHSVGAMHLAGRLYHSISTKLTTPQRKSLDDALRLLLREHKIKHGAVSRYLAVQHDPLYAEYGWQPADWTNIVLFQAVRLAAMVHDIGHPPFSHIVEFALADADTGIPGAHDVRSAIQDLFDRYRALTRIAGPDRPEIHEMVGILLTHEIFDRMLAHGAPEEPFVSATVHAAATILAADQLGHYDSGKAEKQHASSVRLLTPWYLLGQLVSGEVDCDRLDYLRRDPRNSGLVDFGHIDIDRIIRNANAGPRALGEVEGALPQVLVPCFDHRAVSALETFFNERFRQYRWLVCHHNVVRTDTALNRAIFHLIEEFAAPEPSSTPHDAPEPGVDSLRELLARHDFSALWRWPLDFNGFAVIDDAWLLQLLKAVRAFLKTRAHTARHKEIDRLLAVVLERRNERLKSVWKRLDDYTTFATGVWNVFRSRHDGSHPPPWPWLEGHVDFERMRRAIDYQRDDPRAPVPFTNLLGIVLKRLFADTGLLRGLLDLERDIYDGRFLFVVKRFNAYKGVLVNEKDLRRLSSLVDNLQNMWDEGVAIFAFDREPTRPDGTPNSSPPLEEIGHYFAEAVYARLHGPTPRP